MPIIIPSGEMANGLHDRLSLAGAAVLSQDQAEHQDIRPARIALLNLMPAATMEQTETQWLRYMSHSVLQIEPVLMKFDDDPRERDGASRAGVLSRYAPFTEVAGTGLDGLIITGDNLEIRANNDPRIRELLPLSEINYGGELTEVIRWARSNVFSTIYSCLASHFVLNLLYKAEREEPKSKVFGVFDHNVDLDIKSELTEGIDDVIRAPHSRWGNIPVESLKQTPVEVLAANRSIGWLLAQDHNEAGGYDVFMQGHPEYDRNDLRNEHLRDKNEKPETPAEYYGDDGTPRLTWANDARALHANWIASLYRHFSAE